MPTSRTASDVSELLEHVNSIEKLELVRLLATSAPAVPRGAITAKDPTDEIHRAIGELIECEVVVENQGCLRLGSRVDPRAIAALVKFYEDDRATLVSLLSMRSIARIRRLAAYTFGSAIHAHKPKPGGE